MQPPSRTHATAITTFTSVFSILAIELTLKWNSVKGVYTLSSAGQLIPFVIGLSGVVQTISCIIDERFVSTYTNNPFSYMQCSFRSTRVKLMWSFRKLLKKNRTPVARVAAAETTWKRANMAKMPSTPRNQTARKMKIDHHQPRLQRIFPTAHSAALATISRRLDRHSPYKT